MLKKSFLLTILSLLLLTACGTNSSSVSKKPGTRNTLEDHKVINMHGNVENIERLDLFVDKVKTGENDEIEITHYTIEGDPIYDKINFDGEQLTITHDNTEDEYGSKEIMTYTCENMTRKESETALTYTLMDCQIPDGDKGNHEIITINYNLSEQDYFAFRLEYGVGGKNVIDTKEQELTKDLQNGEFVTVSDFQFSNKELQQIYKLMVLSGYLGEKQVSNQCKEKPLFSYKLKVWINQGERAFEWNRCNNSVDGQQMTKLADSTIDVMKENSTYKELPEVKSNYE
jgi:ribosome assembly protein YihI (activator of Der GTPase)